VTTTPWLNLVVVPIYVWRRVPEALLPGTQARFWNVTATALSFGAWAASGSSLLLLGFVSDLAVAIASRSW
jgi:hypothetical protein